MPDWTSSFSRSVDCEGSGTGNTYDYELHRYTQSTVRMYGTGITYYGYGFFALAAPIYVLIPRRVI